MQMGELQAWVKESFGGQLDKLGTDYGVARLLTQAGQLGEATLHKGDVGKELADVLFVVAALANRAGVDIDAALQTHLMSKSGAEFMKALDRR
jgi:NTP pyrophosphatase (non-canonical NTP hydrolase)